MEHTWLLHNLIVALGLLEECSAFPIHLGAGGVWSAGVASPLTPIALGAATLLAAAVLLLGCVCCRQQKTGFQDKTCMQDGSCKQNGAAHQEQMCRHNQNKVDLDIIEQNKNIRQDAVVKEVDTSNENELIGVSVVKEFTDCAVSSQNNLASGPAPNENSGLPNRSTPELTLFPPLGTALNQPGDRSSIVQFEPLPDIHIVAAAAAAAARRKPAAFGSNLHHGLSVHDWFEEPIDNFPRHQLQYLRELGRGWFGRVVEGKAKEIITGHATSKVIVKILHEDATPTDQSYFLHEAKPFRNLKHPNVLHLVGRCLETHPFLLLFEECSTGTLKTFLTENRDNAEKLGQQGVLLEMAGGVAAGLHHMVQNGFVHTDLAARNCLVTSDLTVKVGDYGTSIETFKDEYYCVGDLAIPIRWVAPETLHCTETTIETKEVTASANVWSLSIVLWEICELGKLPYFDLSDEEVIEQVLGNKSTCLPFPSHENQLHVHNLYHLMRICWVEANKRPPLGRIVAMLQHLLQHKNSPAHTSANNNNNSTTSLDDFERRWELSKPNSVPKIDNQSGTSSMHATPVKPVLLERCASLEENTALGFPPQLEFNASLDNNCIASSNQLSVSSKSQGEAFVSSALLLTQKSPSLQNLRGSVDELNVTETKEGSLDKPLRQGPETLTEEPDFDSWLKGMDTSTEDDVRFVRNISEAIRDLDEVLAQEKTSSSSQNSSAQPSPSQVTLREMKPQSNMSSQDQKFTLDFRLGQAAASSLLMSRNIGLLHFNGHESLSLSQHRLESSGSDTEDETWRIRIEKGEFSEKVKEKSKSVADLMILTHIDYSDGSDSDTTIDIDPCGSLFKKNGTGRRSFHRKPLQSSMSVTYGSEGNIHQAVLGEEFQETIKRLQESLRDGSKLEAIPDASLSCVSSSSNEVLDSPLPPNHHDKSHFLAKLASEKITLKNDDSCTALSGCSTQKKKVSVGDSRDELISSVPGQEEQLLKSLSNGTPQTKPGSSQMLMADLNSTHALNEGDMNVNQPLCMNEFRSSPVTVINSKDFGEEPLTSTPIPVQSKLSPDKDDYCDSDSSLMCSQTISFIDSEKSHSSNLSNHERPPSPTPREIELTSGDASCVILGPFEDSTLDYFRGLKTAFPTVKTLDYDVTNEIDIEENSIETWDKFLDHAMQAENCDFPSFSEVSFPKAELESPVSGGNVPSNIRGILGSSFEDNSPNKVTIVNTIDPDVPKETSEVDIQDEPPTLTSFVAYETQALANSCLVVPSVHVTEATPISSGRNTPSDYKSELVEPTCVAAKDYSNIDLPSEEDPSTHVKLVLEHSETALHSSKGSPQESNNIGFAVPEMGMNDLSTQKFDPDLPCCDLSNKDFVSSIDRKSSEYLFSSTGDLQSSTSFSNGLTSECFQDSKLDEVVMDRNFKPVIQLFSKGFDSKEEDMHAELIEDEDEFGLGIAKNLTPDDERSSDSGFRDKGSLSESCEDACDEKYNLEDIEAELEEAFTKGVFVRQDSPTSNKGIESDCDGVDESFSVTLTDVEKQRERREADMMKPRDPCHRLDDLLRSNDPFQEPPNVDIESSVDFFGTSPALSPIPQSSGWYLHPPQSNEESGTEPISGNDSSYFSFSLDEEFVNAIRNELREKLPCAQMPREESQQQLSDEEEHSDQDDQDDSPSAERTSITINYKSYPAPLSPILEEQESLCSDIGSPLCGYGSSSCSEQMSPVFAVDLSQSNQGDGDVRNIESECPAEVDGDLSDDCGDCGDLDDVSEHEAPCVATVSSSSFSKASCVNNVNEVFNESEENDLDDDVLVVNVETNEATLLESPKPMSNFSSQGNDDCDESNHDDFVPNFLSVAGSYQLPESNVERLRSNLYRGCQPLTLATLPPSSVDMELDNENDAMTPDSITCEKSFSERTEDSAVGLALSEVMTPDSLAGESQWTSTQMCDSGFGTIGTRPSSSALMSDGSDRKSPDTNVADLSSSYASSDELVNSLLSSIEKGISKLDVSECPELSEQAPSAEDSESSISFSSNSVVAAVSIRSSEDTKVVDSRKLSELAHSDSNQSYFGTEESCGSNKSEVHFSAVEQLNLCTSQSVTSAPSLPSSSVASPQSLKEIARNVMGSDWTSHNQTLAFNSEEVVGNVDLNSSEVTLVTDKPCQYTATVALDSKGRGVAHKNFQSTCVEQSKPLQTLAFSDPDVTERPNFPGPGHIVVSSIIAPLTPNDDTSTPGTLAFNESPESPCEVLSPQDIENNPSEAESHLMSTSFMSADDLYDDQVQYTPDWESGSDGCESETASSSSGEFIWKDGEKESSVKAFHAAPDSTLTETSENQTYNQTPPDFPMSSILEEEEEEDRSGSSSCSSDSEDDAEFVPSAWDSQATPSRSALRSPDKRVEVINAVDQKKNVSFKRQRYHCVYEYPRELSDSDGSEFADSPSRRRMWDLEGGTYNLQDWDLTANEGMAETPQEDLCEYDVAASQSPSSGKLLEFYKMNSADYSFGSMLSDDGEFFISSSAQPFHTLGEVGSSGSSEFFPGRDLTTTIVDVTEVDGIVESRSIDGPEKSEDNNQTWQPLEEFSDSDSSDTNMVTASEGSFNQQKSGDSNSSSSIMVTANGSCRSSEDSSIYHSLPTNQELQVDSGSDSPSSELSPTSPLSPMSPSHGLGELRHTRDRLKLDLPAPNTTFVLVTPCKRRSVEQVKGEASLLDGEDIFDRNSFKPTNSCISENVPVSSDVH